MSLLQWSISALLGQAKLAMPVSSCVIFSPFHHSYLKLLFFPSHWMEEKICVNVYQISWLIFLFIASVDKAQCYEQV